MPYNSNYYEYDKETYRIVKEDDIHHKLLSTITDEGKLIQWKHKTKINIIKKIKERNLFKSIPETYTIQNVLGFLQTFFYTKNETKYFLTIIGDCIFKKYTESNLYFVSSTLKKIISVIDSISYATTGVTIINNFITKYHDVHNLTSYRLIKTTTNSTQLSSNIIKNMLNDIGIDLLCVATHYSDRYTNADNYLKFNNENDNIKNYILYFVQNPADKIIEEFISQCIEHVSSESSISWKNIQYIWRLYLLDLNIPNMLYLSQLQTKLTAKLSYKVIDDNILFTNITSKYLPNVSSFLSFWDKHITIVNDTSVFNEYEIDELITLYKTTEQKNYQLTDINMINMISHYFYPNVEIIENKYVTNIKCNLWSKQDDINDFLNMYKMNLMCDTTKIELFSFDELYESYKTYFKSKALLEKTNYLIVSKQYFEKYMLNNLTHYIKFEKFVSSNWLEE